MNTNAVKSFSAVDEICKSLTYIGCMLQSRGLTDVSCETIDKFLSGEDYSFLDGTKIRIVKERVVLIEASCQKSLQVWKANLDLVGHVNNCILELANAKLAA